MEIKIKNIKQLYNHPKVVCHWFDADTEDLFDDVAGYVWLKLEPGYWDNAVEDFIEDYPVSGPAWIFKLYRTGDGIVIEDTRHNRLIGSFDELSRLLTERRQELELLLFEEEE